MRRPSFGSELGSSLGGGQKLNPGDRASAPGGKGYLTFQTDGNLVLYTLGNQPLWASNTNGSGKYATLQTDGNLVVYGLSGPLWASNTNGHTGATARMQDDGNFVVYSSDGHPLWATNTMNWQHAPPPSGGGFDLFQSIQQGAKAVVSVANDFNIPGVNIMAAIVTGQNPIDALKQDLANFANAANIAQHLVTGNTAALTADLAKAAQPFGIKLSAGDVKAAAAIASSGGDPSTIASVAMGQGYQDAWQAATSQGTVSDPSLPTPAGASYRPTAKPAAQVYPQKTVALHLGPTTSSAHPNGITIKPKKKSSWWEWALGAVAIAAGGAAAVHFAGHRHRS